MSWAKRKWWISDMSLLKTCESWNIKGNYQQWHNTISKDEIWKNCASECKMKKAWSIAWRIIASREILTNNWRMKGILDEPPCRASMKNSGNRRMIKRKRSWKHKVKPCNDLDGASRRDNAENLELQKKDEQHITEKLMSRTNSGRKELNTWMKQE